MKPTDPHLAATADLFGAGIASALADKPHGNETAT
jgi:hypothetical protein